MRHPSVSEVAVLGVPDDMLGQTLAALVVYKQQDQGGCVTWGYNFQLGGLHDSSMWWHTWVMGYDLQQTICQLASKELCSMNLALVYSGGRHYMHTLSAHTCCLHWQLVLAVMLLVRVSTVSQATSAVHVMHC